MSAIFNGSALLVVADDLVGSTPTYPVLMSTWVYVNNLTDNHTAISLGNNNSSSVREHTLSCATHFINDPARILSYDGDSASATQNGVTSSTWIHIAAYLGSSSFRQVTLNGNFSTSETTNQSVTSLTHASMGCLYRDNAGVATTYLNGRMAEVCIANNFNTTDITGIVTDLYNGTRPISIPELQPYIEAYQPLKNGLNDSGYIGPSWTNNGVTFDAGDHPISYTVGSFNSRKRNLLLGVGR